VYEESDRFEFEKMMILHDLKMKKTCASDLVEVLEMQMAMYE